MTGTLSDAGLVSAILEELKAGRCVALASVLDTAGSMPRPAGARLAVLADGRVLGTVGGGALEGMAEERARAVLAGGPASLERLDRARTGMACGGDALLAVRLLDPADAPVFAGIAEVLAQGGAATLEERWDDRAAPKIALRREGRPVRRALWDKAAATYAEPICAPTTCHVFGLGHVGHALVPLLPALGFRIAAYDDRADALAAAQLPYDALARLGAYEALSEEAEIGSLDSVVVLTHGHAADEAVLARVLAREEMPAYTGCVGSVRKAAAMRAHLRAAGVPQERIDAIHIPIGEKIGAVTPEEIAVSIAAELIRCRAERREREDAS